MSNTIYDPTTHTFIDPGTMPHVYTWNGDGTIATDSCTNGTHTWLKTYTYASGKLTNETKWELQA